jgi:hypothetical protein
LPRGAPDDRGGSSPGAPRKPGRESRRLWVILGSAALAIIAALALRSIWHERALERAEGQSGRALERDTYGGYRDADLALRPFVEPDSSRTDLAAVRGYALAQLASRYGDDQAAVESELLLMPLEQQSHPLARATTARALLLLARGEPGSALLALHWDPSAPGSAEQAAAQVRIQMALQRPDLAHQTLTQALARGVPSLELLHVAADEARRAGHRAEAREFYTRALVLNRGHIPSLVALAEFAADDPTTGLEPPVGLQQEIPNLSSEASPSEHCEALEALTRLALKRADFPTALSLLDRTAELEDAPASCLLELARMDRRIGRPTQALALLKRAAHDDSPGEAPLALGEQLQDPRAALAELAVEPSRDASPAEAALWAARANAARVRANLMLGDRRAAEAAGSFLATDQGVKALLALARLRALGGEHAFASRAIALAHRAARTSSERADDLVDVGEVALALGSPATAAEACDEAATAAPGNCRALICSARALRALGRLEDGRGRLSKALAINAEAPLPPTLRADLGLAAPSAAAPPLPPAGTPAEPPGPRN